MNTWEDRPEEVAFLLNPAFCSILICDAIAKYEENTKSPMPFVLSYLILPIILHEPTQKSLPLNANYLMSNWLKDNPQSRIFFAKRVKHFEKITREAIIFGMQKDIIVINEDGSLSHSYNKLKKPSSYNNEIINRKNAALIGHWFSKINDVGTILIMWGIKP